MPIVNASGAHRPAGRFNRRDVTASTVSRETAPLSAEERRAIARLMRCRPDDAEAKAPEFVAKLKDAQRRATGAAPRPEGRPNPLIDEFSGLSGRDLVKRLAEEEKGATRLLAQVSAAYRQEYDQCHKELDASAEWCKLAPEDRAAILRDVQLSSPESPPGVGTLRELIDSLAACSPQRWTEKRHALCGQLSRALTAAARKLEPTVQPIAPPRRIVRNEADLDAWLSEVRTSVLAKLPAGPVQL
ncbi:MAG: hypothetical protein V5B44_12400 [Candidatus Accumulibacter necessarius]|uniref:hypothetical protein n=1 Tax=Candidatus Accumulibacter necessarius TaxID=2954386 RepID=UPI002FC2D7DA